MLINTADIAAKLRGTRMRSEQDLSLVLGITKYEPPVAGPSSTQGAGRNRNKKKDNPLFHKYNGLDNIKWFPTLFKEGDEVVVQEKLHGTNARASILPYSANTFWKKMKRLLRLAPEFENCYGSNNVEISNTPDYKGFYGEDVYGKTFGAVDVFNKLKPGEIVFGEIVGPGIQKGYEYGLKEHKFVVFDIKVLQPDGKFQWLTPGDVAVFCAERGLDHVPVVYAGPYNKEKVYSLTKGRSLFDPKTTKVREGIVVKAAGNYDTGGNKKALKWVSEDYLNDESNTDFH
jgi:RNA ligase (TIGR02306 family)